MNYPTLGLLFGVLVANALPTAAVEGYLTDGSGNIVKSGYGGCWRTGSWTPEMATKECDPDLVKPVKVSALPVKPKEKAAEVVKQPEILASAQAYVAPKIEEKKLTAKVGFDFDKSELKPEAKDELDQLVKQMDGKPLAIRVKIDGHTDPIGTDDYNLDLSKRRTLAVKDYLAGKGIDPSRMDVEGKGGKDLLVKHKDCKDSKKKTKLISCFAPNRRAEIEIVTTMSTEHQALSQR